MVRLKTIFMARCALATRKVRKIIPLNSVGLECWTSRPFLCFTAECGFVFCARKPIDTCLFCIYFQLLACFFCIESIFTRFRKFLGARCLCVFVHCLLACEVPARPSCQFSSSYGSEALCRSGTGTAWSSLAESKRKATEFVFQKINFSGATVDERNPAPVDR